MFFGEAATFLKQEKYMIDETARDNANTPTGKIVLSQTYILCLKIC